MRSTMPRRCDIVTGLSRQGADVLNQPVDALTDLRRLDQLKRAIALK
jgi:hypothetical protein